jgi:hypothetical protein
VIETRASLLVADRQLHDDVATVVGADSDWAAEAVGDEGVVVEGREEFEKLNMSIG